MSSTSLFDESYYLSNNDDVVAAILNNHFSNGSHHYTLFGGRELRNPNSSFNEEILFLQLKSYYFLAKNSVEEKKDKRIKDTIIAFNQFKNTYPKSKYFNQSKLIHKEVKLLRK